MNIQGRLCFENISTPGTCVWEGMFPVYMFSSDFVSEENTESLVNLLESSYIWKAA
jgi:hypothetical protein